MRMTTKAATGFGDHKFAVGEYVSIREHDDDVMRTFRVVRVEALPAV